jgi:cyanophycin synthetase
MTAMVDLVQRLKKTRTIGVIAAPGDRRDQDITQLGTIAAAGFDKLIIKEDDNRRGRKPGETAEILRQSAIRAGKKESDIEIVLPELDAVQHALKQGQRDDLVVLFADDIPAVWKQVIYFGRQAPPSE